MSANSFESPHEHPLEKDPAAYLSVVSQSIRTLAQITGKEAVPDKQLVSRIEKLREQLSFARQAIAKNNKDTQRDWLVLKPSPEHTVTPTEIRGVPDSHLFRVARAIETCVHALKEKTKTTSKVAASILESEELLSSIARFLITRDAPGFSSAAEAKMQKNKGYQELRRNPDLRKELARLILLSAQPELIAYTSIPEYVASSLNSNRADTEQIGLITAYNYMISRSKIVNFVFENLIASDACYLRFKSDRDFRDAYLLAMKQHGAQAQDYSDDTKEKAERVAADIERAFGVHALLFTKFFLSRKDIHERILADTQA